MARTSTTQRFEWMESGKAKYIISQAIVAAGSQGISMSLSREGMDYNAQLLAETSISPSLKEEIKPALWASEIGTVNKDVILNPLHLMKFTKAVRDMAQEYIQAHPEYDKAQAFHLYEMEIQPHHAAGDFYVDDMAAQKRYLRHIMIVEDNPFALSSVAACKDVDFMKSLGLSDAVIEGMEKETLRLSLNIQNVLGESPLAYHLDRNELSNLFRAIPDLAERIEQSNLPPSPETMEELKSGPANAVQDYISYVNNEAKQIAVEIKEHVENTRQLERARRNEASSSPAIG